jgi:hypothetical protein
MSLTGRPCSCGGRNKNCDKCDGSGLALGGRRSPPTVRPPKPPPRFPCAVCDQLITRTEQRVHADEAHGPRPRP